LSRRFASDGFHHPSAVNSPVIRIHPGQQLQINIEQSINLDAAQPRDVDGIPSPPHHIPKRIPAGLLALRLATAVRLRDATLCAW